MPSSTQKMTDDVISHVRLRLSSCTLETRWFFQNGQLKIAVPREGCHFASTPHSFRVLQDGRIMMNQMDQTSKKRR